MLSASCSSTTGHDVCPTEDTPLVFYTFFSHDGTIKRFPRIAFSFARFPLSCAFVNNGLGSLLLMLPDGFSALIAGFENSERQSRPDTPHWTVGHTPWSFDRSATPSRGASAFASRGHPTSTLTTHGFGDRRRQAPGFIASRSSSPSTGSATATATATTSAGWYRGRTWTGRSRGGAAYRRSTSFFIHGGHRIGMRDIANASPSRPFLRIFIEQIQPSP